MSMIDINEPTKSFSSFDPSDFGFVDNIGYVAYFTNDDVVKIQKINIDNIEQYSYWMSNGELFTSKYFVSFSFERKTVKNSIFSSKTVSEIVKYETTYYTPDVYPVFWPSKYIDLDDIGISAIDAIEKLGSRVKMKEREKDKYSSYFKKKSWFLVILFEKQL